MPIKRTIDFSDAQHWAVLFDELRRLKGPHEVQVTRKRVKASAAQFGFYHGVVLPLAKDWLNETQGGNAAGEDYTEAEADDWLKSHLLGKPVIDKRTGEQVGTIAPSKATFDTKQMSDFVNDVIDLLTRFGVRVPPADREYRRTA
jgi:hypothetical protein